MLPDNIVILDTETTGLSSDDEVISIGIVNHLGEIILNQRMKPLKQMDAAVIKIHGITNEDLVSCEPYSAHHSALVELLRGKTIYCYNADFDSRLLRQTQAKGGITFPDWVYDCTAKKYSARYNSVGKKWTSLANACKYLQVDVSDLKAHDAADDCLITYRLMMAMAAAGMIF